MASLNHRLFPYDPFVTVTKKPLFSVGTYEEKIPSCMRAYTRTCIYKYLCKTWFQEEIGYKPFVPYFTTLPADFGPGIVTGLWQIGGEYGRA